MFQSLKLFIFYLLNFRNSIFSYCHSLPLGPKVAILLRFSFFGFQGVFHRMTEAIKSDKPAILPLSTIKEKILNYLALIYPKTVQVATIATAINEKVTSVRKDIRRLHEKGQVERPFYGYYILSNELFQKNGNVHKDAILERNLPKYLLRDLPERFQFLELGYPVEAHGFHISAYGPYKRLYFEEKFKSGRVKFDGYIDHCEIKFSCRDDPLDAIELSILHDLILEKLTEVFKTDQHTLIIKQIDLHQDRHNLSFSGKRIPFQVIKETFLLAAYETSRKNHPLVQQDKYLRLESRMSFPLSFDQIIESMAKVSSGIHTNISQNMLNITMSATMKQLNYERYKYLSELNDKTSKLEELTTRIHLDSEEQSTAFSEIVESQRRQEDSTSSIDRWAGITAEAVSRFADKLPELKEQITDDHDHLELQILHAKSDLKILNSKFDLFTDDNTYEHEEIFINLQQLQENVYTFIQDKPEYRENNLPNLGIYLLTFLNNNRDGLTVEELTNLFQDSGIPISRGRISQLISKLKDQIKTEILYSGKRGRPKHRYFLKRSETPD